MCIVCTKVYIQETSRQVENGLRVMGGKTTMCDVKEAVFSHVYY